MKTPNYRANPKALIAELGQVDNPSVGYQRVRRGLAGRPLVLHTGPAELTILLRGATRSVGTNLWVGV